MSTKSNVASDAGAPVERTPSPSLPEASPHSDAASTQQPLTLRDSRLSAVPNKYSLDDIERAKELAAAAQRLPSGSASMAALLKLQSDRTSAFESAHGDVKLGEADQGVDNTIQMIRNVWGNAESKD